MKAAIAIAILFALLPVSCSRPAEAPAPAADKPAAAVPAFDEQAYRQEIAQWTARRAERLQAEDGWLSLVGLHWLKEGANRFGSDKSAGIVLPAPAPARMGTLVLREGKVELEPVAPMTIDAKPVAGKTVLLDDNGEKGPTVVQSGTMRFQIIKRGERYGMRVKDSSSPTRTGFKGLDYYPVDPKWRVEARFEKYEPVKKIAIADVTGSVSDVDAPGALVFTIDGQEYRIDPILEEGSDELFLIFRDGTSRDATYPAGRYLYASMPGPDGKVIVDFNKAYNPPCAFTEFATCPLPPPQNRQPICVEAGEKKYAGAH
jgi:hypothetical protein